MRGTTALMAAWMLAVPLGAQAQDKPSDEPFPEGIPDEEEAPAQPTPESITFKLEAPVGALQHGVPALLRYQAKTTDGGRPVQVSGFVVDEKGGEVATFVSDGKGRGSFDLTPVQGTTYSLKIVRPAVATSGTFSCKAPPPAPRFRPDVEKKTRHRVARGRSSAEKGKLAAEIILTIVLLPLEILGHLH